MTRVIQVSDSVHGRLYKIKYDRRMGYGEIVSFSQLIEELLDQEDYLDKELKEG